MQLWSIHTSIQFKETSESTPDIWIKFFNDKNFHGDPFVFDGKGGSLAHAFYPHIGKGLSGDIHLDGAEEFTNKKLLWLVTHEIGK